MIYFKNPNEPFVRVSPDEIEKINVAHILYFELKDAIEICSIIFHDKKMI